MVNLCSPSPDVYGVSDSPYTSSNLRTDGQPKVGRGLPSIDDEKKSERNIFLTVRRNIKTSMLEKLLPQNTQAFFIKSRAENPIRRSDNMPCHGVGWGRMRVPLCRIISAFFYFRLRFVYFLLGRSGFSIPCSLIYSSSVSILAPPVVDRK